MSTQGANDYLVTRQARARAPKRVGVIGGMGPEATIEFMMRLLRATQAEDDIDHIPLVVDNNSQIPSRIQFILQKSTESPVPDLVEMTTRLCASGAEFLVMPCNTAHVFATEIEKASTVPFINAVELAARDAALVGHRVGILGSPILHHTGLYEAPLARHGATAVYPKTEDRHFGAIQRLKASGPDAESAALVIEAARDLKAQGASAILIACTEFSLLADSLINAEFPAVLDTLDLLVQETHRLALS